MKSAISNPQSGLKALSIRQPWAWLILHGGKDIENRTWFTTFTGTVLIHASKGMTPDDYEAATVFCNGLDMEIKRFPSFNSPQLRFGGIVGSVEILRCAQSHLSPWFTGPYGLVLKNPQVLPFRACRGALKFFTPEFPTSPTSLPSPPSRETVPGGVA